jgi:hypothetical protein
MLLNEAAKSGALGNPLSFHEGDLLKNGRNNQTMTMDPTSTWSIRTALWRAEHIAVRKRRSSKR